MKSTIKYIASLFLIFVMAITVTAEPLPITGDGDLLSGGNTGTINEPLPITGDGDLLSGGTAGTVNEPLPITGDGDLLSASFTLVYIGNTPVLIPVVL